MSKKQYGLILPSTSKNPKPQRPMARPSVFGDDSDSDTAPQPVKPTGLPSQTKARKQDLTSQSKAIEEDPTVYQYDEIYDEIDQQRKDSKLARKDLDKKPKYITKLLAAADRRKRENERRIERQVQKEREEEGDQFKDKEAFVTSAYKKKLEELKLLEEQEKREEYLESIGDVKKQGNLDGFYRHLYDQKVNFEEKDGKKEEKTVKDEAKSETEKNSDKSDSENDQTPKKRSSSSDEGSDSKKSAKKVKKDIKKRSYRSRKDSEADKEDNSEIEIKKEHLPSNLDADSDFSIDSSDSEDENKSSDKKTEKDKENKEAKNSPDKANVRSDNAALAKTNIEDKETSKKDEKEESTENNKKIKEEKPKKPKVDIWKKRTVGVVFDEAVKRYFERKALKSG